MYFCVLVQICIFSYSYTSILILLHCYILILVYRFVRDDLQRVEAAGGDILVESMISPKRTMIVANSMMATGADLSGYIQVGKGKNMIGVNPNEGTMAGVCITIVKEQKKFTVFKSGNKTKLQANWFELDGTSLKMCADSKEREPSDFKTVISMASVVFIRDYSTDTRLSKEVRFALELETTDDVISLGLENAFEKDCWMTALTVARDLAVMKRSAYRLVSKDLTMYEFKTHAESYIKQGTIYFSILAEGNDI